MTQSEKKEENCEGADVSLAMWCGCCCWRAITYRYGSFFFFLFQLMMGRASRSPRSLPGVIFFFLPSFDFILSCSLFFFNLKEKISAYIPIYHLLKLKSFFFFFRKNKISILKWWNFSVSFFCFNFMVWCLYSGSGIRSLPSVIHVFVSGFAARKYKMKKVLVI